VSVQTVPGSFVRLERNWTTGDSVSLVLQMPLQVKRWKKNNNAVSISRGPVYFSLNIGERWERYGKEGKWPEWEVFPTSPWNYGLVMDTLAPEKSFTVVQRRADPAALPWTVNGMPLAVRATGRKIEAWQQDYRGLVGPVQMSPAKTMLPEEPLELIPMGAARLRITAFPTVTSGPDGFEWVAPPKPKPITFKISYSYINRYEDPEAVADGFEPRSSSDESISRMSWWNHKGTPEWVQYEFPEDRMISSASVYWYDDGEAGACRVPASWRLVVRDGDEWTPVEEAGPYAIERNAFNKVPFRAVKTDGIRLEVI